MNALLTLHERDADFASRMATDSNGCWAWTSHIDRNGYGRVSRHPRQGLLAHRYAYTLLVGPIPDGMDLDHLCRKRSCVNPAHLEPVTHAENMRRAREARTCCPNGHAYTPENTGTSHGRRACLECGRRRSRRYAARKRRSAAGGHST